MAFRVSTFFYLMLHDITTLEELFHAGLIQLQLQSNIQSNTGNKEGLEMRLRSGVSWVVESNYQALILVSCPPLPARNGLVNKVEFLGLIPQNSGRPMRLRDR